MTEAFSRQHSSILPRVNDKERVIEHYDVVSPYYRSGVSITITDIGFGAMNPKKKRNSSSSSILLSSRT